MTKKENVSDKTNADINDLNRILFNQIKKLETATTAEEIKMETARSTSLVKVAHAMISAGKVGLLAYDLAGGKNSKLPELITLEEQQTNKALTHF